MPPENPGGTSPETAGICYNRLIKEKSPYLLQHAANPVDWYPWGDEAFARALNEDKPVFLSIGYATCHWCHVMAHESFEDKAVAALLNTDFICIKVDREERPDIDSIYMSICQMMTGQGGWPLTIIVTPERKPIFAGTYIPREGRFGGYGLLDLLPHITNLYKTRRTDLSASAEEIVVALRKTQVPETVPEPDRSFIQDGFDELALRFDKVNGGFGNAPKFPAPSNLLFLLRFWKRTGNQHARIMVEKTLDAIRRGGICDQVGGGFHRYSTDAWWRVPHFEKMLYDQALLLMAYTEVFQATRNPQYRKTAEEIIAYVLRDLTSPEGAFFSAEDADSTGGEGAFYLWTMDEMEKVLGKDDAAFAARIFSMKDTGNYPAMAENKGQNILYLSQSSSITASSIGTAGTDAESRLASIKARLFNARECRSRPSRDDKILADWNGLFIAALALAARAFGNDTYLAAARKAMQFIQDHMYDKSGRLLHRYRDGDAAIPAFGDDYASIIKALIELYESSFDLSYLSSALEHNAVFLSRFWDTRDGGFFTTADSEEILLVRKKEIYDGAVPSCNSLAFENLVRLAHLTGDPAHTRRASDLSRCFSGTVQQSPSAFSGYLCALDLAIGPAYDVVIAGDCNDPETRSMIRELRDRYFPEVVVLYLPADNSRSRLVSLAPFTASLGSDRAIATAYVCTSHTCALPVTDVRSMLDLLGAQQD